jgi:meso-butanediol dehydrogenase / (S,S)-butanediol dehydrogenase / diacetyl reductase
MLTKTTQSTSIVTGAARGIGLEIARKLLAQGDHVLILDTDSDALYASHQALAAKFGENVSAQVADVCDESRIKTVFDAVIEARGAISSLVNNAGIAVFKPIGSTSLTEWKRVLDVNLTGPFLCSQAAVHGMLRCAEQAQRPPAIVNICSISGLRASTLRVAYGTSKAGLMHLTRQQAVELGAQGIRVNAVAPGPVDTAMAKAVHSAQIRADYIANIPLARYGQESEIASAVCFLLSEAASYVNGQILAADGGFDAAGIGLKDL